MQIDMIDSYLDAKNITKTWKTKTISISFNLDKGSSLAILGSSGSGKSTILKMIAGLIQIESGSLFIEGKDVTDLPAGKRGVGMVFQDYALFPHLTVQDNISYGLVCRGMRKKEAREKIKKWLSIFEIEHIRLSTPSNISGGEKQRVALARSLAVGDSIILFDEPLSALDTPLRKRLQNELKKHQKMIGYTAIYVTHDEEEARILADRTITI